MENLVPNIICSTTSLKKKEDKLTRYKQKTDFGNFYMLLFIF